MAKDYVNLRQIVKYIHERDIENHPSPEDRLKKLYDTDNEHILEVLNAVNFDVELLKEEGEYRIPREDGKLIEWILQDYTSPQMKHIRKGEFGQAGIEYTYRLLDGLDKMLRHLGFDAETIMAQQQIMNIKTDYHISVRMWNIQYALMRMLHDMTAYMKMPTFNLTYSNRVDYLDQAMAITEGYVSEVREAFTKIWKERKEYVEAHAIPITLEEMEFSGRSIEIINLLHENEEYMTIRKQLSEMKTDKGFLKKYEKERRNKEKRLVEIFREESSKFPIDVQSMTKIEKIMCLADGAFSIHYESGAKQAYVTFDVDASNWDDYMM